ncbi:hypothetical protein QYE76_041378 [Lolium multiflorum]|uniref:CCHC-type domain-containing protein n=1 Tax=Lolium multiflorum TaxID=4521 RepID=A0AAD8TDH5_LOLMU|nr:hypothetical protein QYE76_041378 [Lolium multiflorum]
MDGREGEKKRLLQETGFSSGTCAVPDEKKHRVEEVSQFDGRFEDESQFDAPVDGTDDEPFIDEGPAPEIIQPTEGGRGPSTQLCVEVDARRRSSGGVRVVSRPPSPDALWMFLLILTVSFVSLYRKGKTSAVGAMERKATTHVGSWLSLSCVPSPAKQVGTSRFRAEAMGNENSAPPAAGAWPDLQHKKRNATAELGRDRPGAETAAPLLKWMQNEANEAAVRTMVPAPSSENLYKHEAMGQLGGSLNLDETSVPLLKWIKNDPDEAAVKTMVPPPSSENLLKHKATGQLGGTLFSKQTETTKPSLVKRIATAADEASAEAATKLLSAPPSGCLYKLKSKDQPGRNHPRKLPKSISKDLNAGRRGKISLVMESEGLTVEGRLEAELQKRFEHHDPCDMINELKVIFETHAAVESYEASKQFFGCMMEEGSSVSEHVFAMSGHAKKLSDLGIVIPNQLGIHRVLQSLPPSYKNFVMNYNMQNMNKELPELFSMLKSAEIEIKKEHQVLMVNKTTSFKKQGKPKKGNFKKGGKKAAAPPEKPKGGPKPDTECYYCNGKGHWKRNCPRYPKETIGYTFYHRSEGKIFVAKNGTFLEKEFLTKEVTGRKVELDEVTEPSLVDQSSAVPEDVPVPPTPITEEANDNDHETSNEVATEPRRSTRERTTPDWYDPCLNVMIVDNNDEDPATYEEAMMSPDSNKWQEAMKFEMGSMYDNQVWTLVDLPDSRKAVENKWIFKRKTDADGNVTVYKARLVAKGFRQIQGVDYDETFSPVAKLKSVRILLAIAAFFDYEIWQMDVKTAFLNGDIEEELYMVQPKGFVDPKNVTRYANFSVPFMD